MTVVDYAFPPRPSTAALKAAGATGVSRYLSWLPNAKVIAKAEFDTLIAAGFEVVLNWEYDAKDLVNSGFDATKAAQEALRQARALGYPDSCAIYFSADWDVSSAQWPTIRDRLRAIGAVLGPARVGLYAPYDALTWAKRDGVAAWFWQSMSTAFSGRRNAVQWPGVHIWQRRQQIIGGADCDASDVIQKNYGQYGGSTMPTDADWQQLHAESRNTERLITNLMAGTDAAAVHDEMTDTDFEAVQNVPAAKLAALEETVTTLKADVAALKAAGPTGTLHVTGDLTVGQS